MKRLLALLLAALLVVGLAACGTSEPEPEPIDEGITVEETPAPELEIEEPADGDEWEGIPIALITDYGTIDDGSFNQGSWEGVVAYAEARGIPHQYIQPAEVSDAAYIEAIALAIDGGAQIIVTPGFLFATAIYEAQTLWPEVKFVLLDAVPDSGVVAEEAEDDEAEDAEETEEVEATSTVAENTVAVLYAEQESGFLAGYAAVMEGHRSLGFIGGIAVPAVVLFGTGFVEGAEYAATNLGLGEGEVTVNYAYAGTFSMSPEVQTMAASWFNDGVEVIFAAAGGAGFSVFAAAEAAGALAIGVDIDQAGASETVLTSALKELQNSVYSIISDFFDGNFPGGQTKMFDASLNGVGLPMETSRFENFTLEQYVDIFSQLANGTITLSTAVGAEAHLGLNLELVEVISVG